MLPQDSLSCQSTLVHDPDSAIILPGLCPTINGPKAICRSRPTCGRKTTSLCRLSNSRGTLQLNLLTLTVLSIRRLRYRNVAAASLLAIAKNLPEVRLEVPQAHLQRVRQPTSKAISACDICTGCLLPQRDKPSYARVATSRQSH